MSRIQKAKSFIEREIWQIDLNKVGGIRHFLIKLTRTFIIAWQDFKKDNCQLKASALTFYTLLSVVPVIAMLFGVAKGFGFERRLETEFKSDLSYNQEIIMYVFDFANSMLENTKGGLIAGLGVMVLLWTVMKVLSNIEESFNDIWEITSARSWVRKFSDYMSVMLVAPLIIILTSSIIVYINTTVKTLAKSNEIFGYFGSIIFLGLELLPVLLTTALFTMLYMVLPNTKVKPSAAILGAFFAALIFMGVEWMYLTFQVGVSRYNAIYGGFAALPLFLAWVQTNWLVVLLGAELSFAFQNQSKYEFELEASNISHSYKFILSVAVVHSLIKRFEKGEDGPTASDVSEGMEIPPKLVRRILNDLVQSDIVREVADDEQNEARFLPAIDINKLDLNFVLRRLNDYGINDLPVEKGKYLLKIEETVNKAREQVAKSTYSLLVKDL